MPRPPTSGSFKPGHKFGRGRPKGSTNKRLRVDGQVIDGEKLDAEELLRACFRVVRDERATRDEVTRAASVALPYMKPRMSAVEISGGTDGEPVRIKVIRDEREGGAVK